MNIVIYSLKINNNCYITRCYNGNPILFNINKFSRVPIRQSSTVESLRLFFYVAILIKSQEKAQLPINFKELPIP